MKNETILKKAIEKASRNGWDESWVEQAKECLEDDYLVDVHPSTYWWIFSHDFAKAFWGERSIAKQITTGIGIDKVLVGMGVGKVWQYHLSKMVLEKEPLKYLEKFL